MAAQITKAGYKTTEFWIVLLVILSALGLAFQNKLSPEMAVQVSAILGFAYQLLRTLVKSLPQGANVDAGANGGAAVLGCPAVPSLPANSTTRSTQVQ